MVVLYYFVFFEDIMQYLDRLIGNATRMMFDDGFAHFLCCVFALLVACIYFVARFHSRARSVGFVRLIRNSSNMKEEWWGLSHPQL